MASVIFGSSPVSLVPGKMQRCQLPHDLGGYVLHAYADSCILPYQALVRYEGR